ncbi:hydroxymethylpyrimidine kinase /phosphomethylpyrimidine kinase [Aliiroseovarius halocynthiae]|uniref:hydroxymethylpyrimidine kinase n=1 Tax=Aliiroseovarius halocynthiae TaxID=985055 RepID=A0A545SU26_9RHOB|nr:bifunctional hydroxymethylpyrimidine kinase/phosphomethylpyrimidine kinase [Aliiroseovarius halocynthiae]TQV68458.1 bifunctional hydroxymethylpyrimidine kinase/phosphomethylpyrimidine kinase [Aliiroseovarius halocynthiae]SMR70855.1 hydroxymethylpyrimidine kinase /phosphomethylpyrimidine kinase [Aliiroseovarius halocynthiae]
MAHIALTIAGSDSGGGAGIQADLKAMSALGVFGASVITAVTAQNTQAVTAVHSIPLDVVTAQIDAVLSDLDVRAIKIGMLATPEIIETIAAAISDFTGPVVLDPVMIAKSGDALLARDAVATLRDVLLPRATVLTPNLPEAACLLDQPVADMSDEMATQGRALVELGAQSVLMKGGHAKGEVCRDILISNDGAIAEFTAPRRRTNNTHGTGCTLSSSIAAGLAKGLSLQQAVSQAHHYLQGAIGTADDLRVGHGHGPVHHFHQVWQA